MGYGVVIADNFSNSSPEIIGKLEAITGKNPKLYEINIADKSSLKGLFAEDKPDAVIHLAGYKAVGESVKEPLKYYENNICSTLTLLETMEEYSVNNLIFSSSATVYGDLGVMKYTEDMKLGKPSNPYGNTKQMIEQIIFDTAASSGLNAVILRYFNPIGAHKSGLIGEKPQGVPNNLMPYIQQVASGVLPELKVFGNDYNTVDGTGVRDYLHVVDLARGHVSALEYCTKHKGVEVFNLGTGKGYSVLEIIKNFESANGIKIPYTIAPRRDGDLAEFYADASKASRLMDWKAELGLEDMCRDTYNFKY
jgi:UDP-glucose 4-epimerase